MLATTYLVQLDPAHLPKVEIAPEEMKAATLCELRGWLDITRSGPLMGFWASGATTKVLVHSITSEGFYARGTFSRNPLVGSVA